MLENLRKDLTDRGFGALAEKMEKLTKPTIRVTTRRAREENFRLGQSKIGGLCHLPPDFQWPIFDGDPLSFIAQINLEELPRCPEAAALPDKGILYFFYADNSMAFGYSPEDKGAAVVHYYGGDPLRLKPTEKAPGENDITVYDTGEIFRFKPCSVTFETALEMPGSPELIDMDELLAEVDPARRAEAEEIIIKHMYGSDEDDDEDGREAEDADDDGGEDDDGPLVFTPDQCQPLDPQTRQAYLDDPATAEMLNKLSEHASKALREAGLMAEDSDEVPLTGKKGMKAFMKITEMLNCDSDFRHMLGLGDAPPPRGEPEDDGRDPGRDDADMMWGDLGTLYFTIKKDDLAAGNFDRIWFSFQCH